MPQKTIIIGMGSQGDQVCELIGRRIESEFGKLSRIPWVRMLVYETETRATTSWTGQRGISKHTGIDSHTFSDMTKNPAKYNSSIDLQSWADMGSIAAGGVPTNGANNRRMTGRLCWLTSENFAGFDENFRRVFNELSGLSPAAATAARGKLRDGTNPSVDFPEIGASGRAIIRVFVVGSLTGGTNSGSFIDVGYYLQTLSGISNQLETTGIFSIPNPAYKEAVHWGNAYGALTELNHYHCRGKVYDAKYPNSVDRVRVQGPPYGNTYILQPRGGGEARVEEKQLIHAVSEVIHLTAIGAEGNEFERSLVNAKGNYADVRDQKGRPMNYSTFGASTVLFPLEHIFDGCAAKLGTDSISEVLKNIRPSGADIDAFVSSLGLTDESYQSKLRGSLQVTDYLKDLARQAQQATTAAIKGDPNALSNTMASVAQTIGKAFTAVAANAAFSSMSPIRQAAELLTQARQTDLPQAVNEALTDPRRGVIWTQAMLAEVASRLQDRSGELERPNPDFGLRLELESSEAQAQKLAGDFIKPKGCFAINAKKARNAILEDWSRAVQRYWAALMVVQSEQLETRSVAALREVVDRLQERVGHSHNGYRQHLEKVNDHVSRRAKELNDKGPIVNGLALFEANKTIGEEHARYLPTPEGVALARQDVRQQLSDWVEELFKPIGLSAYDRPRIAEPYDVERVCDAGGRPFQGLHDERVERRLIAWPNWQAELERVAYAGRIFADPEGAENQYGIPSGHDNFRRPAVAYFHSKEITDETSDAGRVNAVLRKMNYPTGTTLDPHRILFTEALAIFSCYSIRGVEANKSHYNDERRSRIDVAWQPLDGSPLDQQQSYHIGLLLAGLAFGIIEFRPSGPFIFTTRATPMHAAQSFQVPRDLADATFYLSRNPLEADDLKARVLEALNSDFPGSVAKLITFNQEVEHWNTKIENEPLDNKMAFLCLLPFANTIDGLIPAIIGSFKSFQQPSIQEFRTQKVPTESGLPVLDYYGCTRCGQYLAHYEGDKDTLSKLPDQCPSCSMPLRLDKLSGLVQ